MDKVIAKFKDYKAKDIVDYMHDERAYKETKSGEIIPFSLAKEIKAFLTGRKESGLISLKPKALISIV